MKKYNPKVAFAEDNNTWFCALVAIRYCMGRQSYAPSLVQMWVKDYWNIIPQNTRVLMLRDVTEELDLCKRIGQTCGDKNDHSDWDLFRVWLKENIDRRTP